MKKFISILLAFVMVILLVSCSKPAEPQNNGQSALSGNIEETPEAENIEQQEEEKDIKTVENKDAVTKFAIFTDAHIGKSSLTKKRLKRSVMWANETPDLDFILFLGDNIDDGYFNGGQTSADQLKLLNEIMSDSVTPYFYVKGNHDANTAEFYDNVVVQCGDVAVVSFFASYYCPDPNDIYTNHCKVSTETQLWLEQAFKKCAGKRLILACHFSIVTDDPENFTSPIGDARNIPTRDNEFVDFGREKILELADKYNVELYFNGHEHNAEMPIGTAGPLTDYNLPGLGFNETFVTVTVDSEKAVIELRNNKNADEVIRTSEYKFTRSIIDGE